MQPAEFRPAQNYDTNPYYDSAEWPGPGYVAVEPLNATENDTYTAPEGKAYSPVTVNVAAQEYDITCVVNSEPSESVVYPAKVTEGKWERDGDTPLDTAQAGQILIVPNEYTYEDIFYASDPLPDPPVPVPVTDAMSLDDESAVFVMPAHDIGVVVTTTPTS